MVYVSWFEFGGPPNYNMFDVQIVNWLSSSSTFKFCSALDQTVLMSNGWNNEIPKKCP